MRIFVFAILFFAYHEQVSGDAFERIVCERCAVWCGMSEERHQLPDNGGVLRGCEEAKKYLAKNISTTGGIFDIKAPGVEAELYCDTVTDSGGWTVFQRRIDGSIDFYRGWNDYVNGFGDKMREFWLGLETIYQMTKGGDYEMRIDMIRTDGTYQYAKYGSFAIGQASDYYRLSVGGYCGNATDQLNYSSGMQFTTKDKDNDPWGAGNCATDRTGAWWYKECTFSNLNGVFGGGGDRGRDGLQWFPQTVKFSEMKFRKKE